MDCPKCGGSSNAMSAVGYTTEEARMAVAGNHVFPAKTPHAAAMKFAGMAATMAAKAAFSKAYQCQRCDHQWRKWF